MSLAVLSGIPACMCRRRRAPSNANAGVVLAYFGDILERLVGGVNDQNLVDQRRPRRRLMSQTMLPASRSRGVLERSESKMARLISRMGRTEPSGCSYFRVAPKPSQLASQYKRKGRELSATASQSGKIRIGGAASSRRISPTMASMAGVK